MSPTTVNLLNLLEEYGVLRVKCYSKRYDRVYLDLVSNSSVLVYVRDDEMVIMRKDSLIRTFMV